MKWVKRIGIAVGVVLILIVAAAFIIPVVFKDDIKRALDKALAENVNADVVIDLDKFSLSVFRNFPNITAEIREIGVFNRAPFEGVPLFVANRFDVEVNLMDVLFGDQLSIKGITLEQPQILVKVLPDGRANYDIAMPSADTVSAATDEPAKFSLAIERWQIIDGDLTYDDQSLTFRLDLKHLNHTGSGNFNEQQFDLNTRTVADTVTVAYDGVEYLTNKRVEIDAVLGISEAYTRYTFKENTARVNDFVMSFDGWFKMNESDYGMDIAFKSPENSFKSLLSLVPGVYTQDFGSIETKGDLAFAGFVKGTYSDTQMPAFNLALNVNDAMFKYPDLPTAISNIQMDLLVDNKTGVIENTVIDLKKLHLDFGANPVDARLLIENLRDYRMDGNLQAKLNLAELSRMFPIEGLEMKGILGINASAKGIYDSVRNVMPAVDAALNLSSGYVKSSEFPIPLEDLKMEATVKNASGKMAETVIAVNPFAMLMDGEKFTASLLLQNLNDYTWDVKANGGIDLEKITKIFPLEGMTLAGKVKADLETKGKMSDLNAQRYDKLPTSGNASLNNFRFMSADLPYAVTIAQSAATFDPRKIEIKTTTGTIGKSDFTVAGALTNYIGYVFGTETVKGNLDFSSNLLDLNEFMTETEESATTDSASYGVIPVPQNLDFVLHSDIKTVKMMDYTITNAQGDVVVRDGVANLSGVKFNLLGGAFVINGAYDTRDLSHPRYDMAVKIDNMSIQQAANSFSIIQKYAPVAGLANGTFNTDFKINGELQQDMMPNLGTVNAEGLVKVVQAALTQSKLVAGITSLTKLDDTNQVTLKDVVMSAQIKDGRLSVKPFNVKFGDYVTTVSGSSGLDMSLAYNLKMMVPAGKLGSQMQSFVNQYTGSTSSTSEIPLNIGMGGTFTDPKFSLLASEQKQQVQQAVTEAAQQKGQEAVDQLLKGDKPQDVLNSIVGGGKKDTTKTTNPADTTKKDAVNQIINNPELKNKLNNLLKKKKNN
ncbi:MAG: hypothetical protein JNL17_11690 [Cyclobacteriaceae bacterium]|nr:hypothetical protein [Cyclobacteriaceae bacterium]